MQTLVDPDQLVSKLSDLYSQVGCDNELLDVSGHKGYEIVTLVAKCEDSSNHHSKVAEAEDDKATAQSVGTKVENVKMVKKAAFAFKKKKGHPINDVRSKFGEGEGGWPKSREIVWTLYREPL